MIQMATAASGAVALSSLQGCTEAEVQQEDKLHEESSSPFSYALNVSTIRGQKVGFMRELEIAAEAGYDGIEIWINGLQSYVEGGGTLNEVRQKAATLGIEIVNAIGFASWIVDDKEIREKAFDQAKREMEQLASIGCKRIAAPPAGATQEAGLDLNAAAERYHQLLELGASIGVIPQLEVWGFSANLHKLSQVLYVAAESNHPKATILPDVYHLYKGGSGFNSLRLLNGVAVELFHMNDFPSDPSREEMGDEHRVYPGDGVAPITQILSDLRTAGGPKILSLELFNRNYWEQDALAVAKTGLAKMKAAVGKLE